MKLRTGCDVSDVVGIDHFTAVIQCGSFSGGGIKCFEISCGMNVSYEPASDHFYQ